MAKQNDQYSEREAQRRFMAALKAAVNTPPKPLKDVPKKRAAKQAKRKRNSRALRGLTANAYQARMSQVSMTCLLALNRQLNGQTGAHLGIDFLRVGWLPVSEISGSQDALFDLVLSKALRFEASVNVGEPFIVGVLQVARSAKSLDFVPILSVEPSEDVSNFITHE
jgi:hypothetical protein